MGMANSIEGRFPFLDVRVMEFAAKLPPKLKMKVLNEKYLLKLATNGIIPESIRRRPKQPYRAPDASSFFDAAAGPTAPSGSPSSPRPSGWRATASSIPAPSPS